MIRYGDALWAGVAHLHAGGLLTPNLFSELATIINHFQTDARRLSGTRIANPDTRQIVYSPPEGENRLWGLLHNLCEFLYTDDDIDPLIKLAVAYYPFEAIHPFPDGNGRTGRVINILYLIEQGLLQIPSSI